MTGSADPPGPVVTAGTRGSLARDLWTSLRVSAIGVVGRGFKLVTVILLARSLGPPDFGKFASAFSVVMFVAFIPLLGADQAVLRYASPVRHHRELVRLYTRRAIFMVAIFSSIVGGVVAIAAPSISRLIGYGPDFVLGLRLTLLIVPAYNILVVATSGVLALRRPLFASLIQDLAVPLATLVAVLVLVVVDAGWEQVPIAYVLGFSLALLAALAYLRRGDRAGWTVWACPEPPVSLRQMLAFGAPIMAIGLLAFGAFALDTPLVAKVSGTSEAGVYAAASRLATYGTILQFGLVAVFVPRIAELCRRGETEELGRVVRDGTDLLVRLVAPFSAAAILLSRELMGLPGGEYQAGVVPLAILLLAHATATATLLSGYALVMLGRQMLDLLNHVIFFAVVLAGGYWAGSFWGATGVAVAVATGVVAINLAKFAQLRASLRRSVLPSKVFVRWGALMIGALVAAVLSMPLEVRLVLALALALCGLPTLRLLRRRGGVFV